jgi:WD40 repeat protein
MQSDVFTASALNQYQYTETLNKASDISYDGKYTLIADGKSICLWRNSGNKLIHPCKVGHEAEFIELVGISKNNQYYFISNRVSVRLYSTQNNKIMGEWRVGENIINDIAMSAGGNTLLLGFRNGYAAVINVIANTIESHDIHRLDINSVSLSDDGKTAFTGSSDKHAVVWNAQTGEKKHDFVHQSRVNHVVISSDATHAFSIDAIKGRFFWQVESGLKLSELASNKKFLAFNDSVFSSDNKQLLTASPKQKLHLWRVSDGKLLAKWQAMKKKQRSSVLSVAFNDDNTIYSLTSDSVLENWPLKNTLAVVQAN